MQCASCGASLKPTAKICIGCGTPVPTDSRVGIGRATPTSPEPQGSSSNGPLEATPTAEIGESIVIRLGENQAIRTSLEPNEDPNSPSSVPSPELETSSDPIYFTATGEMYIKDRANVAPNPPITSDPANSSAASLRSEDAPIQLLPPKGGMNIAIVGGVIAAVILAAAGGGSYWYYQNKENCKVSFLNDTLTNDITMSIVTPYRGGCKDGMADGQGSYTYIHKQSTEDPLVRTIKGEFHNGKRNGYGTITDQYGEAKGEFRDDQPWNVIWRRNFPNGDRWATEWRNGVTFARCISNQLDELNCTDRDRLLGKREPRAGSATAAAGGKGSGTLDAFLSLNIRLLFYGYPQQGQPRTGMASIDRGKLIDIQNIVFTKNGGELSPDGQFIAYDNCQSPNRGIYIASLDGSRKNMIVALSEGPCVQLRWSPDAQKLSYGSYSDNRLHIVQIDRRIDMSIGEPGAGWHSWSPTGNAIVFEKFGAMVSKTGSRLLYITDMSGNLKQLTFSKDNDQCETWAPDWSPDGRRIAFTSCKGKLYTISPNGKALKELASATSAYAPRWSQDGQWIVYLSGKYLMRISKDGGTTIRIGELPYSGGPFSIARGEI